MKRFHLVIALSLILFLVLAVAATTFAQDNDVPSPVPATGVTLSRSTLQLVVGEHDFLRATILPLNATDQFVTWSSSNPAVATVVPLSDVRDARITGISPGTSTITVTTRSGNRTATALVTVRAAAPRPTPPTGGGLSMLTVVAGALLLPAAALAWRKKL